MGYFFMQQVYFSTHFLYNKNISRFQKIKNVILNMTTQTMGADYSIIFCVSKKQKQGE